MSGLLNTPDQEPHEHIVGYLRRLASCNGYRGWRDLVRAVGFKPTKAVLQNEIGAIMNALGVQGGREENFSLLVERPQRIAESFFQRPRYEPVCVRCLQESESLRREWSHCLVVACPQHQCQLIDRCPHCHEMLENTRMTIATCDCGFDLRYATAPVATALQCWSSARMTGDMQPLELVDEIGTADDYLHLADLLFQLSIRFKPNVKIKPGSSTRPQTVDDAIALLHPVLALFEDLQPRFTSHIAERFAAGNQSAFNLNGRLGPWYKSIERICKKARAFPMIWQIFSDAVFENFDGLIRGQIGLTPSHEKKRQYLGIMEAAKLIGVSKPVLLNAIEKKQMRVRTGREGISYAVHMLSREECEAALHARSSWISMAAAAGFLNVSKAVLRHLINAGIVTLDDKWQQSVFKAGPICKAQLTEILERMNGTIQVRTVGRTLRLDQIDARRTVDLKALVRLYCAIFSGELHAVGREAGEGLAGLMYSADEVTRYLGSAALDSALTLNQLALATGWKYACIAGWTKQNLLESEIVVLQGKRSRVVTVEGLARFRREWIPVAEIAAAVDSKGSAVSKHLETRGITISGLTREKNGAVRGGLIRISDLGQLAGLANRDVSRTKCHVGAKSEHCAA